MTENRDPAVVDWAAAIREVIGAAKGYPRPDRRTPMEQARDDALEAKAEARADHRSYDYEGLADEAADRYERHLERGEN